LLPNSATRRKVMRSSPIVPLTLTNGRLVAGSVSRDVVRSSCATRARTCCARATCCVWRIPNSPLLDITIVLVTDTCSTTAMIATENVASRRVKPD